MKVFDISNNNWENWCRWLHQINGSATLLCWGVSNEGGSWKRWSHMAIIGSFDCISLHGHRSNCFNHYIPKEGLEMPLVGDWDLSAEARWISVNKYLQQKAYSSKQQQWEVKSISHGQCRLAPERFSKYVVKHNAQLKALQWAGTNR